MNTGPAENTPGGANAWGATNQQPPDPQTSSMPSSTFNPATGQTGSMNGANGGGNVYSGSTADAVRSSGSSGDATSGPTGDRADVTTASASTPSDAEIAKLDDAELAAVMEAVGDGEVRMAQLAEGQATNTDVKRFAHEMSVAHQGMLSKDRDLLSRIHITPAPNSVSGQLDSGTQSQVTRLTSMHGDAFDREYVETEVHGHIMAIELVESMASHVKSPALRTELTAAKPKLQAHLRLALATEKALGKGGVSPSSVGR
jgi:putative membrane protein